MHIEIYKSYLPSSSSPSSSSPLPQINEIGVKEIEPHSPLVEMFHSLRPKNLSASNVGSSIIPRANRFKQLQIDSTRKFKPGRRQQLTPGPSTNSRANQSLTIEQIASARLTNSTNSISTVTTIQIQAPPKFDDVPHLLSDGSIYIGKWENGLQHGKGKLIHLNGTSYDGDWVEGKKDGDGIAKFPEGHKCKEYNGKWKDGNYGSSGKFSFADGGVYDGGLLNGKFDGDGTYFYSDGTQFTGKWKEGKKHGEGTYTYPDKRPPYTAVWVNGIRQGKNKSVPF